MNVDQEFVILNL